MSEAMAQAIAKALERGECTYPVLLFKAGESEATSSTPTPYRVCGRSPSFPYAHKVTDQRIRRCVDHDHMNFSAEEKASGTD